MASDLIVNSRLRIPSDEVSFSFVRSSGPGGQNVNKVNSKAELRWNVSLNESIPESIRQRLTAKYGRRINQAGELLVTSQRYRDQKRNIDDCVEKLRQLILAVAIPPKPRKATKVSQRQKAKRLEEKRRHSQRKESRRLRPRGDD
ncbi:MAG: aminoacyl-tRNA hydrolase [Planctomycetales bacterium]|nr:aminoacyl-tRNA hydrolase [Planctomycetales bacterium]